ncbi:subunit 17 of mediator complex-domain-containing protein [Nemania sp. FL0031]|nr:subunit 17 of mediator complex-domain-containing protein [Nemania sp. FL0031]
MAAHNQIPFALRPWPTGDKKPQNLAEFFSRMNTQPGGFRDLREDDLRREMQAKQQGQLNNGGTSSSDEGGDEDEDEDEDGAEGEAAKGKTAAVAREEFLRNINGASTLAMYAVDTVSLLLSKESPVQASTTISPGLRDAVGIGTLGASKLKDPPTTPAQIQNDLSVATGWRVMGINNMVDSVLAAAERLEKEIEFETKYWADVLAVSDDGWTVCALPQEQHTLGVRFGFAESAPDFRNNSIAPLIRNDDGTIRLGVGKAGGGSQRVRVTVKRNSNITDQSPLPERLPDDAPLKDRVREARNTIFHQELWYELNREARVLLAYDVYYKDSAIVWKQNKDTEFIFTLEDLGDQDDANANYAEGVCCSTAAYSLLQFLLFQSHRQSYQKRTSPSLAIRQADPNNSTYNILRILIARFEYFRNSADFDGHLDNIVYTLRQAGISTASYNVVPPPNPSASGAVQPRHTPNTELLWVQQLVANMQALYTITITSETRLWCRSRGIPQPFIGTYFFATLKHPFTDNKDPPQNWLETVYPPAEYYTTVQEAVYYLCQAATRVLSRHLARIAAEKLADDSIQSLETISGIGIKNNKGRNAGIDIEVVSDRVVLTLKASWRDERASHPRTWTWASDSQGVEGQSIEDVVLNLMGGGP